jgi:hypothetical protein
MIYFECYSDETFLSSLGVIAKDLDHSFSKGNVCNKLDRSLNCVGLVDEDPNEPQPRFIQEIFNQNRVTFKDKNLIFCFDKRTSNKLVLIRPNIEVWSVKIAQDLKIDLEKKPYQLSSNSNRLHEMLAFSRNIKKFAAFKQFFVDSKNHHSIVQIKEFIFSK